MSLIGQTLGQYQIVEAIGSGGMATVYKAYQPGLDRHVAVKVLPAQHALTPGFKERFIREARAVAQLSHPNILPIYDVGFEGDLSYFVMKYVEGHTLRQLMGRPMPLVKVSRFIEQAARALDHAHARGILHRDVKPGNMLLEDDWLLLADFGLAKIVGGSAELTATGAVLGTPTYVSAEQAEGKPVDHRTDIYSLGIVLYEMVTGRAPYDGETPMQIIFKHIYEPLPPPRRRNPDLPEAVEQVIFKAVAKDPAERFNRASELAEALLQAVAPALVQPEAAGDDDRSTAIAPPPEGEAMTMRLVGPDGQSYDLTREGLTLGRSTSCDVRIKDLQASRRHASLAFDGQTCIVYDEGSANGTFVNGQRVGPKGMAFEPGDTLTIGTASFTLQPGAATGPTTYRTASPDRDSAPGADDRTDATIVPTDRRRE
ncbi:MAG: protein kinase [Anaerolineae bacterium]